MLLLLLLKLPLAKLKLRLGLQLDPTLLLHRAPAAGFQRLAPYSRLPLKRFCRRREKKKKKKKKEKKADVYRRLCWRVCTMSSQYGIIGEDEMCVDSQSVSIETAERCRLYRAIVFGSSDQIFLLFGGGGELQTSRNKSGSKLTGFDARQSANAVA